jgi:DNA repair protein RecN (Recombination protein N)
VALISDAQEQLDHAAKYSDGLRTLSERLLDLLYTAQDISDELRDFRAQLDFTPGELDELEVRLDVLRRVTRKYGGEKEALEHLERGRSELSDIEYGAGKLVKLEAELEKNIKEAAKYAEKLSAMRRAAAGTLESRIMNELSQLNMPGVSFIVEFNNTQGEYGLSASGCDEVCFLMSDNAGEAPGRVCRIASGGELARIMLALKNVLSDAQDSGAMIFDEIDTGVSGIAAQRVGEKLAMLAKQRQVLCVTHLPQIAAMADTHFEIQKSVSEGRTYTYVNKLDHEGRKMEIARLSGGENITVTALTSAAEQLSAAEEFKNNV